MSPGDLQLTLGRKTTPWACPRAKYLVSRTLREAPGGLSLEDAWKCPSIHTTLLNRRPNPKPEGPLVSIQSSVSAH